MAYYDTFSTSKGETRQLHTYFHSLTDHGDFLSAVHCEFIPTNIEPSDTESSLPLDPEEFS